MGPFTLTALSRFCAHMCLSLLQSLRSMGRFVGGDEVAGGGGGVGGGGRGGGGGGGVDDVRLRDRPPLAPQEGRAVPWPEVTLTSPENIQTDSQASGSGPNID